MATATHRPRKTVQDYLALPDDVRAELIAGALLVTPAPRPSHQECVLSVAVVLRAFAMSHETGRVFVAPVDVYLPSGDIVQPDVVLVAREHEHGIRDAIRGPIALAVEVVSSSHPERDRIVKRDLYAHNGVPEYWIVDPDAGGIEVVHLHDGSYEPAGWFTPGTTLVSKLLPGFSTPADDLLGDDC